MKYTTSELPVAAYLRMKGIKMISATSEPSGRFVFVFSDSESKCQDLVFDFFNGEFCTFDSHLKSLKKMIYSRQGKTHAAHTD